jgi:hypothetical protein
MEAMPRATARGRRMAASALAILLAAGPLGVAGQEVRVTLSGSQEIPPATTSATGTGMLTVKPDKSVTGSVTIAGMVVTVAHIHEAPAGANGPIVVPLVKTADNVWSLPPGARFSDAQYESYKAGHLYFNIHSEAYKSGEIRGQIRP